MESKMEPKTTDDVCNDFIVNAVHKDIQRLSREQELTRRINGRGIEILAKKAGEK